MLSANATAPRSENAFALFVALSTVLLEEGGRLLREIIRLLLAVESEPLADLIARLKPEITIPAGVNDLVVPKGMGWIWLGAWLVSQAEALPAQLIPDVAKVFQAWLIAMQHQRDWLNEAIVGILFNWLARIEDYTAPRTYRSREEAPPALDIPHMDEVRDEIRMIVLTFANQNGAAAAGYLTGLGPDSIRYYDRQTILKSPGTLPQAAPGPFVDFVLQTLTERDDQDRTFARRRGYYGPFEIHEHVFLNASQDGEPFLSVFNSSPLDGLRLVRGLVEHATEWRRELYSEERRLFPRLTIPFRGGEKSYNGDLAVYRWTRDGGLSLIATTALRALEAWAHQQLEQGRPFEDVLHDVLGPSESSVAFVAVAVDIALSHWPQAASVAWPLVATPELLQFDEDRYTHDISGVSQLIRDGRSSARGESRANLDMRPSRQTRLSDKIGQYVFGTDTTSIDALRNALENVRQCIRNGVQTEEADPIHGLRATVERALRMTHAENWVAVRFRRDDGSEIEGRQFKPEPEEERLRAELAANANANLRRLNIRHRIQSALLAPEKSTAEFLREALEWAKAQPFLIEKDSSEDEDNYDAEWNRRAVVMTAALAAREYVGDDRGDVLSWAHPILLAASEQADKEYFGSNQVEYNTKAIAALGLISLYIRERDTATRDIILRLAAYEHPAVLEALGRNLFNIGVIDARLPRAFTRIVMASAIHPHRADSIEEQKAVDQAHRAELDLAIAAEKRWLDGEATEPAWPELPAWKSRPRRRLRLGDWRSEDDDEEYERPSHYVDEHARGALMHHLVRFVIADVPDWIKALADHLMVWTDDANGPHGEDDHERDDRPDTWNIQFFDFVGILSVALPHLEVVDLFLDRIVRLQDEAFHDISASFLRGYDRATVATDTKEPENPAEVRALLAGRIKQGWNYRRLGQEKEFTSERHAGDALTAMFYQPHRFASVGRPTIPSDWPGLRATMATLTDLVVGAPTSGYLATLFLNLIESSHDPAFIPFVVKVTAAWCAVYGIDRNLWAEKNIGSRACAWIDAVIAKDASSRDVLASMADELFKCLDILVQSGVAHAHVLEDKITNPERKAG